MKCNWFLLIRWGMPTFFISMGLHCFPASGLLGTAIDVLADTFYLMFVIIMWEAVIRPQWFK